MPARRCTAYLNPAGILNAVAGSLLLRQVQSGLRQNCTAFLVDCVEINAIDAQGLECLLQIQKLLAKDDAKLSLFNVNQAVIDFLAENELGQIFDVFPNLSSELPDAHLPSRARGFPSRS
jgi:anti-anti-sigma regulatory factor